MPAKNTAKSQVSALAAGSADQAPAAMQPRAASPIAGDAASAVALARLDAAAKELKALATAPLLREALNALRRSQFARGEEWCLKALTKDAQCGLAWYMLGICREKAGDFKSSLQAYEAALGLLADQTMVANDLGRLALRLGMWAVAAQLFVIAMPRFEDKSEPANNMASALREMGRFDEAIEVLRTAITTQPEVAMLWNSLGSVLSDQGDVETALPFFEEALRLDPTYGKAAYNRGNIKLVLGDAAGALADCELAMLHIETPAEAVMMKLARSSIRMAIGDIGAGWDDYEARFDPALDDAVLFRMPCPRWTPGESLAGKRLVLMAEQGLGDEVLFANTAPDIAEAVGPGGHLTICVEWRLVDLFQRSFPKARVLQHATYSVGGRTLRVVPEEASLADADLWTPMGTALRHFRRRVEDFPDRPRFLTPDAKRVKHWQKVLSALPGPKVGILWKSLVNTGARGRYFSPFDQWAPVLKTPGVTFVNLQYGDCAPELEQARRELGVEIFNPPGIDLKNDLDDVSALACALDLTLGFANATINLAAACGGACWMISTPGAWTLLGTDRQPWYPQMRVFLPEAFGQWEAVMDDVAAALKAGIRAERKPRRRVL